MGQRLIMSYILDALKKSDHERKQGSVPSLQTVHIPMSAGSGSSRWPYFIIAFLMLSLAFVVGMLRPWEVSTETARNNAVKEIDVTENVINPVLYTKEELTALKPQGQQIQSLPEVPAVIQQDESVQIEVPQIVKTAEPLVEFVEAEKMPVLEINSLPHLYDMPPLVRQAIPDMSFAGHVYSSEARQRSVIVNGHSMSEGEIIIEGLKVEQIIHNGVVFNYQGQLFRMDILQDWSFD